MTRDTLIQLLGFGSGIAILITLSLYLGHGMMPAAHTLM